MFKRLSNLSILVILILIVLAFLSFGLSIITVRGDLKPEWWSSFFQNLCTEMIGAFLTYMLIEQIVGGRQEKERLTYKMRSSIHHEAIRAIEEFRHRKWLKDGSLHGRDIRSGNLVGAYLKDASLQGANLGFVNLQKAYLENANLQQVDFWEADLRGTILYGADLRNAKNLDYRQFDTETILPDGSSWAQTDLGRFTDPSHPNFWRSDDLQSPAYRGRKE